MELFLLIAGMIALLGGKVWFTNFLTLEGDRARIFGGFLVAPWIIAFASDTVIGKANPAIAADAVPVVGSETGFFVFWGCVAFAFVYAFFNRFFEDGKFNFHAHQEENKKSSSASKSTRTRKAA